MREPTKEEQESINQYIKSISKSTGRNFFDDLFTPLTLTEEEWKRYCNRLAEVSVPSYFTITWLPVNGEEYHVFKCSNCGKYQTYKSNFCEDCGGAYLGEKD